MNLGLFDRIFGKTPKGGGASQGGGAWQTLTAYQPVWRTWDGKLYESALIRAAVDARARHVSKLSVEISGAALPKLTRRLSVEPNSLMTWSQFLYRLSTILDLQSTAFIAPVLDRDGEVEGFFPLLPDQCEVVEFRGQLWLRYHFSGGQTGAMELAACGILTRFQYRDDLFGTSNGALRDTMELMTLQSQAIEEAVKNSASYRFMARLGNFASAEDLAKEKNRFTTENFRSENGAGVLLFPYTYQDIKQIDSRPYTVDEGEAKEIRTNVYNYFGVNEDILQNKAFGDAWDAFYEGAIEPFAVQCSEVLSGMLYTRQERRGGNNIMLSSNRLQFMSASDKLKVSAQMADRGLMSRNEIRDIWNLPPIDGGDVYTIRGEYYTLGADGTVRRTPEQVEEEVEEIAEEVEEKSEEEA